MTQIFKKIVAWTYETVFGESARTVCDGSLESQGIKRVAAGDPSKSVSYVSSNFLNLPAEVWCGGERLTLSEYSRFLVEGSSMVPRGVLSGDLLLCKSGAQSESRFAIVSVDKDYYDDKNKELKFDFKLRHTLLQVSESETEEALAGRLEKINPDILLDENKENFRKKYKGAARYLDDPKRQVFVSETFRNGHLRYSFNPVDLISYSALYAMRRMGDHWKVINLKEECPA